ncbi:hypothetical protein PSOL_05980 [Candidatus Phytoplasma solani]
MFFYTQKQIKINHDKIRNYILKKGHFFNKIKNNTLNIIILFLDDIIELIVISS